MTAGHETNPHARLRVQQNASVLYLTASLVILNSGAVYFQQVYAREMTFALLGVSIFFYARHFIPVPVILTVLGFSALSILNYGVFQSNAKGYFGLLIRVVSVSIIVVSVELRDFGRKCLNVISVLALTSIPFYILGLVSPGVVRAVVPITAIYSDSFFRLTPFYIYGPYNFERNNGVFWEAGAYAACLNVGVALALLLPGVPHRILKVVLLLVVLLSTQSTTGYLIAPIWFACLAVTGRQRVGAVICGAMGSLATAFLVFNSAPVVDKFAFGNTSYSRRTIDTTATFQLMLQRPWTGWGFQNIDILEATYGGRNTSNSLLGVGYQWGLLPMLALLALNFFALRRLSLTRAQTALGMCAYVMIMSSEDFILSPMFLFLLIAGIARGADEGRRPKGAAMRAGPAYPAVMLETRRLTHANVAAHRIAVEHSEGRSAT